MMAMQEPGVEVTPDGFRWGPLEVLRTARLPSPSFGYVLTVRGEGTEIEVYVSEKGRSLRVFRDGKEMT
jgi:hypothetical protein